MDEMDMDDQMMDGEEMDEMDMEEGYDMNEDGGMLEMEDGQYDMDDMGDQQDYGDEDDEFMRIANDPQFAHMPPIDRMHKIRRNILQTINDIRRNMDVATPEFNVDIMAVKAANDYASYLLNGNEDEDKLDEICKSYNVEGKMIPLVGFAILEEDEDHQGTI